MILMLVRFMQIGRARESWQIYHKALARFMDLPAHALYGFASSRVHVQSAWTAPK